jgi:penicillin-binding protein 1A
MPVSSRSSRSRAARWTITAFKLGIFTVVALIGALVIAVYISKASLPAYSELQSSPNGQMVRVHASDGTVIISLGPSYGEWLPYDRIPPVMVHAMVGVEDRRYYMHPGVDPVGIARSAWVRVQRGHWAQGGSTITQQLARNIFLTNTRTFGRKFREIILALAMERKFTKEQILELYLNRVYFGGGAYGIDAAARKFFGHTADKLSLPEAAIIAGLVKAPSHYSPTADAAAAIDRAKVVIDTMRDTGQISAAEAAEADPASVKLAPEPKQNSVRYFTDWALAQLDTLIDETAEPIDVWTTLDLKMQRAADAAIRANAPPGAQGALVAIDRGGAVRAMVGGKDYVSSIYNRATQAVRQPGSAFKLFVYLAALEAGHKPEDPVVDEPIDIEGWSPRNSSGRFSGPIDIRTAFAFSINTVAAKLGSEVSFQAVADMARRFGITTPVNVHPSMVLGTSDVRLIDMTRAFAAVGAKGIAVVPFGILKVTAGKGRVLYEHEIDDSRVLVAPAVAAQMTDLLQTAVNTGTGRAAQIGRPVAGKTGTTTSNKDGWFLGFSSGLTTGVWMGRDDSRAVPGLSGGHAPAQAFHDFMIRAVADRPVEEFETEVKLPDWQLEPDDEAYYTNSEQTPQQVDENGMPIEQPGLADEQYETPTQPAERAPQPGGEKLDQQWLDGVLNRGARRPAPENRPNQ